jgi:hypothetical protein
VGRKQQTFHLVYFHQHLVKNAFDPKSTRVIPALARDTYPNPAEYRPLMPHDLTGEVSEWYVLTMIQALRTFHDYFHITHKTMNDTQRLRNGYPSLLLGQSIQSLEYFLYLGFS